MTHPAAPLPPEVEAELRRRSSGSGPPAGAGPEPRPSGAAAWLLRIGPVGAILLVLFGKLKYLAVAGKFLLPALKTGGTMLISIVIYAQKYGWGFATGFVVGIFVHEMGHVFAAWRLGIPVTAPVFIPFVGAFILQKKAAKSAWDEALIGVGGPIGGTLAGLAFLGASHLTGSPLLQAIAFATFFINLFNLAPVFPLDGGWITGAVSPRLWLAGLLLIGALFLTGVLRNPIILIIILLSLPRMWKGIRTGDAAPEGTAPATPHQRWGMGFAYAALCGLLTWLMGVSHPAL